VRTRGGKKISGPSLDVVKQLLDVYVGRYQLKDDVVDVMTKLWPLSAKIVVDVVNCRRVWDVILCAMDCDDPVKVAQILAG
jgi:hypothetical protein